MTSIGEEARKLMVQQRQHAEHLDESMLNRSVQEVETHVPSETEEEARELLAKERLEKEHLQENMLSRASEEIE